MGKFEDDLDRAITSWREVMKEHANENGVIRFPSPAQLTPKHISDARVYADRYNYLTHLPKGGRVAEVGVWRGDYSDHILRYATPKELHLFDLDFKRFAVKERFAKQVVDGTVVFHDGDSAATMEAMPDEYFDWIYIDAGHDYASVKADATLGARKVKKDGILIFNDYIFWSHTEARPYGVIQAVNELCVQDGWLVKAFCLHPGMYCDIAVARS